MTDYIPKPEHKFSFGLWTMGNIGRHPFGGAVRDPKTPTALVCLLGEVGAYGVNFHDNDLLPIDATPAEAERIKREFRKALDDTGIVVPMVATNLFGDPIFKDGAFTSSTPHDQAQALKAFDRVAIGSKGLQYQRPDQLTISYLVFVETEGRQPEQCLPST